MLRVQVFHLLTTRQLVVFPFLNPWGFSHLQRQERGVDPNRDFPYLNPSCFTAATSKCVVKASQVYRKQIVVVISAALCLSAFQTVESAECGFPCVSADSSELPLSVIYS